MKPALLALLAVLAAALCWPPYFIRPHLDLPFWLVFLAGAPTTAALAVLLQRNHWHWYWLAVTVATFAGLLGSALQWPTSDPIAATYVPFGIAINTTLCALAALAAALAARRFAPLRNPIARRLAWSALLGATLFGPVTFALTPTLVARRIARNDRLASLRFHALKAAVERTDKEQGRAALCDGRQIQRHYNGPPFTDADWERLAGNAVFQDGYAFMIHCRELRGKAYALSASSWHKPGYGTRLFCTDESRQVGCNLEWNRSRYACQPCPR